MTAILNLSTPHLDVMESEDLMEVMSDVDRQNHMEEDVDIDLDLEGEHPGSGDDDYMVDDEISFEDEQQHSATDFPTVIDDDMVDEAVSSETLRNNRLEHDTEVKDAHGMVEDTVRRIPIEELREGVTFMDAGLSPEPNHEDYASQAGRYIGDTGTRETYDSHPEAPNNRQPSQKDEDHAITAEGEPTSEHNTNEFTTQEKEDAQVTHANNDQGDAVPELTFPEAINRELLDDQQSSPNLETQAALESTVDDAAGKGQYSQDLVQHVVDTDINPSLAYVDTHPVIVTYLHNEMSLFPLHQQETEISEIYLLPDRNLFRESVHDLLQGCRDILGDSIQESDELEVHFPELDLYMSESLAESSTNSMADILSLFLQLHHHDGTERLPPLRISLSSRASFSRRFSYLIGAATEGTGLSQIILAGAPNPTEEHMTNRHEHRGQVPTTSIAPEDDPNHSYDGGQVENAADDRDEIANAQDDVEDTPLDPDLTTLTENSIERVKSQSPDPEGVQELVSEEDTEHHNEQWLTHEEPAKEPIRLNSPPSKSTEMPPTSEFNHQSKETDDFENTEPANTQTIADEVEETPAQDHEYQQQLKQPASNEGTAEADIHETTNTLSHANDWNSSETLHDKNTSASLLYQIQEQEDTNKTPSTIAQAQTVAASNDEDDLIDYEDDEDEVQDPSSASSTLQGDISEQDQKPSLDTQLHGQPTKTPWKAVDESSPGDLENDADEITYDEDEDDDGFDLNETNIRGPTENGTQSNNSKAMTDTSALKRSREASEDLNDDSVETSHSKKGRYSPV